MRRGRGWRRRSARRSQRNSRHFTRGPRMWRLMIRRAGARARSRPSRWAWSPPPIPRARPHLQRRNMTRLTTWPTGKARWWCCAGSRHLSARHGWLPSTSATRTMRW